MVLISFDDIYANESYSDEEKTIFRRIQNGNDSVLLTDYIVEALTKIIRGENICCLGPGGTGKSTTQALCDYIYPSDKILRLAPTGTASLNMDPDKAKTIHSLFKIGEKSLLAYDWEKVKRQIRKNKEKIKEILDSTKLIIIDEWSMIISGLFTTFILTISMIYGNSSDMPTNNIQIVFMGDILQLPPVKNYDSPYINESTLRLRRLDEDDYLFNNMFFKNLITRNNIINFNMNLRLTNRDDENTINFNKLLEYGRVGFTEYDNDNNVIISCPRQIQNDCMVILNNRRRTRNELNTNTELFRKYDNSLKTCHTNNEVDEINNSKISELKENGNMNRIFEREIMEFEDFRERYSSSINDTSSVYESIKKFMDNLQGYKVEFDAVVGERVMLRVNNIHPQLRNGSLGTIVNICDDCIEINFDKLSENILVKKNIWKHPEFSEFTVRAFPLIPAWAITTHKLQGQTIDGDLFIHFDMIGPEKPHLLYTAISRITDIRNLYIICNTPIKADHFNTTPICLEWYYKMLN